MHKIFLFISLLLSIFIAKGQNPTAFNFGDSTKELIGEKGTVDQLGNTVMVGRIHKSGADYPMITCFDASFVQKFSFSLNITGFNASALSDAGGGEFVATFSSGVNALVLKFNLSGNIIWYKRFSNLADLESILIDNSGNIYVAGGYLQHVHLIKMQPNGNITWVRRYNFGSNYVFGRGLVLSSDNKIMMLASATYTSGTTNRISLLKVDLSGTTIWKKTYWSNIPIVGNSLARSPKTNRYMIAGYKGYLNNVNTLDAFTLLVDSAGNYIHNMVLGYVWWDMHYSVAALPEGGFVSSALCKPQEICGGNGLFVKYTDNNDTVLTRVYGAQAGQGAMFQDIKYTSSGIVAFGGGSTFQYWNSGKEFECLRFNTNLDVNCHRYNQAISKTSVVVFEDTATVTESTIALAPSENKEIVNEQLKAGDVCLQMPLAVSKHVEALHTSIYPNPNNGVFQIRIQDDKIASIALMDVAGKVVVKIAGEKLSEQKVELNKLSSGTYFVEVYAESGKRAIRKLQID